jgi:hypothetical protein
MRAFRDAVFAKIAPARTLLPSLLTSGLWNQVAASLDAPRRSMMLWVTRRHALRNIENEAALGAACPHVVALPRTRGHPDGTLMTCARASAREGCFGLGL